MAKKAEKTFNSFVKGLVTEASELTFPEGALVDGENFVLKRDGSLERRLGIDYENLYSKVATGLTTAQLAEGRTAFYRWNSPSGVLSLLWLRCQAMATPIRPPRIEKHQPEKMRAFGAGFPF